MKQEEIGLKYKKNKFKVNVKICSKLQRISGLMFTRKEKAEALLFNFNNSNQAIHSYFVFFPFIAIWLDKNNKIIEIRKIKPFTFHVKPNKPFSKLIEIPINNKYKKIIEKLQT